MDFYADVLDHMGKTPREFGAIHAHFEGVTRDPATGQVVASVLFQAAFDPPGKATLKFYDGSAALAGALAEYAAPALPDGAVMRGRFPLKLRAEATEVFVRIDGEAPGKKAERIRPAWKLHDTVEIPKLSEMNPIPAGDVGLNVGDSLLHSVLAGGLVVSVNLGGSVSQASRTTVHKAKELPPGLSAVVAVANTPTLDAPAFERIWAPGDPLPASAIDGLFLRRDEVAPRASAAAVRRCISCGFEGAASEYERARFCPTCDAIWA